MARDDGFELIWPGKYVDGARAPLEDRGASFEVRERFGEPREPLDGDALILGDNLLALEALVRARPESADLIYIDPPFATGTRFSLARRVGDKRKGEEVELRLPAFDDAWEGGAAGLLRMLDPRLRLLHGLLAPTGSLYVHVDPIVGHAVKLLLDEIFGRECFQREIVWRIGWLSGFKTKARNWIRNHDLIFFYVKDPQSFTFNKRYIPHPPGYRRRDGKPSKAPGVAIDDVWNANAVEAELSGRESLDSIQIKSFSREKTGWATQKNESLLRRIIDVSSNPGDRVVDVFAGSGTTAAVAAELGRRFWSCDHAEAAVQIARRRLLDGGVDRFCVLDLDGRERALALEAVEAAHGEPAMVVVRRWILEQLGAEPLGEEDESGGLCGRRGHTWIAVLPPGQASSAELRAALLARQAELGAEAFEIVCFDGPPRAASTEAVDASGVVTELLVTRGIFQAGVRQTPWLEGGLSLSEVPKVQIVERVGEEGSVLELRDVVRCLVEGVPESLRGRPFHERVLGWSVASQRAPTSVLWSCHRERGRGPLELSSAALPAGSGPWLVAIEDVLGLRTVVRVDGTSAAAPAQ